MGWNRLIYISLVNDLGDDLRSRLEFGDFRSVYSVRRGILHEKRQQREDAPHEKTEDEDIDDDEDDYSAPHCVVPVGGCAGGKEDPRRSYQDIRIVGIDCM
jgi:hypothetical protein